MARAPKVGVYEARFMRFMDGSVRWSFTLACGHQAGAEAEEFTVGRGKDKQLVVEAPPKKFYCRMCPRIG
jgi:hypothetical protein